MMKKLFEKMDALPIVRLLQITAMIIFIISLCYLSQIWYQPFREPYGPNVSSIANSLQLTIMKFQGIIFEPLILLALAEIIKQKRLK